MAFYNWYYVSPAVAVMIGSRRLDIGAGEILALEEERLARRFRECIGETVTEIRRRPVIALAEAPPSAAGCFNMFDRNRRQFDRGAFQQYVEFVTRRRAAAAFHNDGYLQHIGDRHGRWCMNRCKRAR